MRKVFLFVLILIILLGFIGSAFASRIDTPHNPVSIKGGLRFEIPYSKRESFYISGLFPQKRQELKHFLTNEIIHPLIDSTQVLYDGELMANSGINYINSDEFQVPKTVTIYLQGDLDPKKIRGFMKK